MSALWFGDGLEGGGGLGGLLDGGSLDDRSTLLLRCITRPGVRCITHPTPGHVSRPFTRRGIRPGLHSAFTWPPLGLHLAFTWPLNRPITLWVCSAA